MANEEESEGGSAAESDTVNDPKEFCAAMDQWADLLSEKDESFASVWRTVRLAIRKSCLLDRVIYGGEQPSKTPCPVHKGKWSGCHLGWPEQTWSDGMPVKESPMLREWFDAGCRCFKHSCGCTTGWQVEVNEVNAPEAPPSIPKATE